MHMATQQSKYLDVLNLILPLSAIRSIASIKRRNRQEFRSSAKSPRHPISDDNVADLATNQRWEIETIGHANIVCIESMQCSALKFPFGRSLFAGTRDQQQLHLHAKSRASLHPQ